MKAHLMFKDKDFSLVEDISEQDGILINDLELDVLFNALSAGDKLIYSVARHACLSGLTTVEEIKFRQDILSDAIRYPEVIKNIYNLTGECIEMEKKTLNFGLFSNYPSSVLHSAINVLKFYFSNLKALRNMADRYITEFTSEGFVQFFSMLQKELDEGYLATVSGHLQLLKFHSGVLISARLGQGNSGTNYVLRRFPPARGNWLVRLFSPDLLFIPYISLLGMRMAPEH
ncbi:hypothetical protein ABK905_11645 [Acerihabitans sp. KWT182]|uniref:Uncharacterized protein n=1 Tax=Acerihabitans sp. KWT182 TaxID=3157919 RepID=A0AAU7QE46_9GAMM